MNIEQQIREFLTGQSAKAYQVFGSHPAHKYGQDGIEMSKTADALPGRSSE